MALPKKGLRKITINDFRYGWSATGSDGWISLTVAPMDNEGQLLTTSFDYHNKIIEEGESKNGNTWQTSKQQFIVTPYIVKQVIEYALKNGWNPFEKGPQFKIPKMDDKIDLRISE